MVAREFRYPAHNEQNALKSIQRQMGSTTEMFWRENQMSLLKTSITEYVYIFIEF